MPNDYEDLALAGVPLNDGIDFDLEAVAMPAPERLGQWVESADADGAVLVEPSRFRNRTISLRLHVVRTDTMDHALDKIGAIVATIAKSREGWIPLTWTPANSNRTVTARILEGDVNLPIEASGPNAGYLLRAPYLDVTLTAEPFFYGSEITGPTATSTEPLVEVTVPIADRRLTETLLDLHRDPDEPDLLALFVPNPETGEVEDLVGGFTATRQGDAAVSSTELAAGEPGSTSHDGTNDYLTTDLSPFANGEIVTVVLAASFDDEPAGGRTLFGSSGNPGVRATYYDVPEFIVWYDSSDGSGAGRADVAVAALGDSVARLLAFELDEPGDEVSVFVNGTLAATDGATAAYPVGAGTFQIATYQTGTGVEHLGKTGAVALFSGGKLSAGAHARLGAAQAGYFAGDLPSEARIVVTDGATQNRDHVEIGVEAEPDLDEPADLLLEKTDLVAFDATSQTRTGSYGANVWRSAGLSPHPLTVCGTNPADADSITHRGRYRVKARVYSDATNADASLRLRWKDGAAPFSENGWASILPSAEWAEVDLGVVEISEDSATWEARVQARSETLEDLVEVDYLLLIPASRYQRAATTGVDLAPTSFEARDDFTTHTVSTYIGGKTAPVGGAWTETAASTFLLADGQSPVNLPGFDRTLIVSTTATDRFAHISSGHSSLAVFAAVFAHPTGASTDVTAGVAFRVSGTNFLLAALQGPSGASGPLNLIVEKRVAGTPTVLFSRELAADSDGQGPNNYGEIGIIRGSGGEWAVVFNGVILAAGRDSDVDAFATGGAALYYDASAVTASARFADFRAWEPEFDHALYAGLDLEAGLDTTRREIAADEWGEFPYRGAGMLLPNGTSRVVAKARRGDVRTTADSTIDDSLTVSTFWTPRYLTAPR